MLKKSKYNHIRKQIDDTKFDSLYPEGELARDKRGRMHSHLDIIEELESQKRELNRRIKAHLKTALKELTNT